MAELQDSLPYGWECKFDIKSGRRYFINHATKMTTWDDPRVRKRSTANIVENIPLQHGSPDTRRNYVYPSQTSPIPAFQLTGNYSPKYIPLQEIHGNSRMSPLSVKGSRTQDSSLTVVQDTEESVAKISAMFPTVSDTHIRLLLKKYHNREAVVISALQVEKHPITTPGPFATPPPIRNIQAPLQMTPPLGLRSNSKVSSPILRPGSGCSSSYLGSPQIGESYHNSPRPHSSPKLKLRYMKSIFPKAEETIILDVLANNDNNIQKASEKLKEMGFEKRDVIKILRQQAEQRAEEEKRQKEEEIAKAETPPPKILTVHEKEQIKQDLQKDYSNIEEQVIIIALESVNFDKEKADQILKIMVKEDTPNNVDSIRKENETVETNGIDPLLLKPAVPISLSKQSIKSLIKSDLNKEKNIRSTEEKSETSQYIMRNNSDLAKGPNDKLLLENYLTWQGPDPSLVKGPQKGLAKGQNWSLRIKRTFTPCGPNSNLKKGPVPGLAKGSIFTQLKSVMVGESRGK